MQFHATLIFDYFFLPLNGGYRERVRRKKGNKIRKKVGGRTEEPITLQIFALFKWQLGVWEVMKCHFGCLI